MIRDTTQMSNLSPIEHVSERWQTSLASCRSSGRSISIGTPIFHRSYPFLSTEYDMRSSNMRNFVLFLSLAFNLGLLARWTVGPLRRVDISMQNRSFADVSRSLSTGFASLVGAREEQVSCDLCAVAPELCERFGSVPTESWVYVVLM